MEQQLETTNKQQLAIVSDAELLMHLDNLGITKELSAGEKNSYLQISKAFNLNPFKREIHVSKYNGVMSIITGYEVYIKRAERSGLLDGWECTTEGSVETHDLKAIITIWRKDRKYPFKHEVEYSEYVQTVDVKVNGQATGEKRPTKFWMKAKTMIKKVAMSQGFRLCFSDELGGMPYTSEEMPEQTHDITYTDMTPKENESDVKADRTAEEITILINACQNESDVKAVWKSFNAYEKNLPGVKELVKIKGESFKIPE